MKNKMFDNAFVLLNTYNSLIIQTFPAYIYLTVVKIVRLIICAFVSDLVLKVCWYVAKENLLQTVCLGKHGNTTVKKDNIKEKCYLMKDRNKDRLAFASLRKESIFKTSCHITVLALDNIFGTNRSQDLSCWCFYLNLS